MGAVVAALAAVAAVAALAAVAAVAALAAVVAVVAALAAVGLAAVTVAAGALVAAGARGNAVAAGDPNGEVASMAVCFAEVRLRAVATKRAATALKGRTDPTPLTGVLLRGSCLRSVCPNRQSKTLGSTSLWLRQSQTLRLRQNETIGRLRKTALQREQSHLVKNGNAWPKKKMRFLAS